MKKTTKIALTTIAAFHGRAFVECPALTPFLESSILPGNCKLVTVVEARTTGVRKPVQRTTTPRRVAGVAGIVVNDADLKTLFGTIKGGIARPALLEKIGWAPAKVDAGLKQLGKLKLLSRNGRGNSTMYGTVGRFAPVNAPALN